MKIKEHFIERMTLEKFADKHKLTMEVHERSGYYRPAGRYYAHFEHSDVKEGAILKGEFGNGSTPEEAVKNYGQSISETTLVIDAMTDKRRVIHVPVIVKEKGKNK